MQLTQGENLENLGTGQENRGQGEKLFTQEEVNGFVQSRISRLKGQLSKEVQAEYNQKMAELQEREMSLATREQLSQRGMPLELADVITCSDEEDIKRKLDTLQKIYGPGKDKDKGGEAIRIGAGYVPASGGIIHSDPVRDAMGLKG